MQGSLLVHDLRKVITLVDLLRDIGLDKQLSLPKVVVLGNQSSGKSSLLEQIVGLDFLPRGSGVVTRRPLQLRLNNMPDLKQPYAEFDEVLQGGRKKRFIDFNQVRKTIDEVTEKVCGKSKEIIDNPIVLNIFSNSCPNLTIVDLPGITSIPVGGQPKNIYQITKNMALRYVGEQRSIILCVIPANQDLSTSQALKILQEIDPTGKRSIGCLTKIDIMDRGVDAKKILKNEQIPLKYGYVGIKNRSQEDINNNTPVSQSLKAQRKYFTTSPIYSTLPPQSFGTQSLTHKLTSILYTQIKSSMPEIFQEIKRRRKEVQIQLEKLGPGVASTDAEMVNYAWKSISDFLRIFKNSMNGIKNVDYAQDPISAQIRKELNDLYLEEFQTTATQNISDKQIEKAIINFPGDSIPGFPSIDAFLAILTPLLKKLQQPAYTINNKVHQIMQIECVKIIDTIMIKKYPDFNYRFTDLIKKVLEKFRKQLESYLNFMMDSQLNQLYTNDISYLQGEFGLTEKDKKKIDKGQVKDPLLFQLRKRIDSYYRLCVRNLRDLIPKQIFNFLIVKCVKEMEFQSFQFTSDVNKLKQWLNEPGQVRSKRQECQKAIKVFEESEKKIKMDPEICKLVKNTKQSSYYKRFGMKSPDQIREEKEAEMEKKRKDKIISTQMQGPKSVTSQSTQNGSLGGQGMINNPNNTTKVQQQTIFGTGPSNPQTNPQTNPNTNIQVNSNKNNNTGGTGGTTGNFGNITGNTTNINNTSKGTIPTTLIQDNKGTIQQQGNTQINNTGTQQVNQNKTTGTTALFGTPNVSNPSNTNQKINNNSFDDFWNTGGQPPSNPSGNNISPQTKKQVKLQQPKPPVVQAQKKKSTFNNLFGLGGK